MDRNLTYTKTITMITEICYQCAIPFGIPSDFKDSCLAEGDKKLFYCPNGHGQVYTKSNSQKLQEKFDKEKLELEQQNKNIADMMLDARSERDKLQKQLNRVHNGVCPCCNRSFVNLQRHMKTKHPEKLIK